MLERSEKKSCEDASDDRVIRNIRNVIREKEELKEQRKSGSFMYGVSAFLVVVIIVIGINLMNNYEKMRRLNQSVDNLMNQLEGNERRRDEILPRSGCQLQTSKGHNPRRRSLPSCFPLRDQPFIRDVRG